MRKKVEFGSKIIGDNERVPFIAEIGVNHLGKIKSAINLVESSVRAGSDFLKFQTYIAEDRYDKKNPRYGVTASKKIGNAVERNKAKRRIRHAIKEVLPKYGKSGYDYVVIATIKTNKVSWNTVLNDLEKAFREIK